MVSRDEDALWRWIGLPCLAFGAAMITKIGGGDIWWHVRTGEWIASHGLVPTVDPFSYTAPGPWRDTEALTQLLYFGVHSLGGALGLQLLHAACGVGIAALVAARGRDHGVGPMSLALGLAGAASFAAMTIGAAVFTFVLAAAVLMLLAGAEGGRPRRLYAVAPLFALWANLHWGGLIGLGLLLAAALAWSFEAPKRALLRHLLPASALSALALFASSEGLAYYANSLATMLEAGQRLSLELVSIQHSALLFLLPLALYGGTKRRCRLELFAGLFAGAVAVFDARLLPLVAITVAPAAAAGVEAVVARAREAIQPLAARVALVTIALAAMAGFYRYKIPEDYQGLGVMRGRLPVDVASFLAENPAPGELWHSAELGSYLLFALAPERRVFIDGRGTSVHRLEHLDEVRRAPTEPPLLLELLERYGVNTAIVANRDQLPGRLSPVLDDAAWRLVYWDDVAAVMVRRRPESEAYIARLGYDALRPRDGVERIAAISSDPERDLLAADVLANVERAPGSLRAQLFAATLHRALGDSENLEEAEQRLAQIAAERGVDIPQL